VVSEGYGTYTATMSEIMAQRKLYFIKLVYTKPDYTLEKKGEGLHLIHQIDYENQYMSKKNKPFEAFRNIEINYVNKKKDDQIVLNFSCFQ
jgi:hypothetical protein